jgi:hypothetical protein
MVIFKKPFLLAGLSSLLLAVSLSIACWNINPWPSDAEVYYMPAAKELPKLSHLSDIHQSLDEERIKWLHGKEYHVAAIAFFQKVMGNNTTSLRPLLLLGIVCIFISSLLIFSIARRLFGEKPAFVVWFLFATSFWPYLYILFTKHQTQGLMFFVLALWLVLKGRQWFWFWLGGLCMAVSIFSSTVSTLYVPFIAAALIYVRKDFWRNAVLFLLGFAVPVIYANYPDIAANLKSYWDYIKISGQYNHFFYNQRALVQWIPSYDLKDTRGGWVWIIKYFTLVMPIVFPLYIASVFYVLKRSGTLISLLLVVLSFLPTILAEVKGVAQYGANYFPAMFGMLMLIGYATSKLLLKHPIKRLAQPAIAIAVLQLCFNAYIFLSDVYPSRMVTTNISNVIKDKGIKDLYTFRLHPLRPNIIDHLSPTVLESIKFTPIDSVIQVPTGYILLPPPSTDSIYRGSNGDYNDFDQDLVLNQIIAQGKLGDYAIASFKTLGSSLVWSQEEEILAYRYGVLNQFSGGDKSKAWILDAAKIQADRSKFMPTAEDLFLYKNNVKNIGTVSKRFMYTNYQGGVNAPTSLKGVAVRIFKMGDPKDNLRAYIFKVDEKQPTWKPYSKHFISKPLSASLISSNPNPQPVVFEFDPAVQLDKGTYSVVIYRDGSPSDIDFYRIYADQLGRIEE